MIQGILRKGISGSIIGRAHQAARKGFANSSRSFDTTSVSILSAALMVTTGAGYIILWNSSDNDEILPSLIKSSSLSSSSSSMMMMTTTTTKLDYNRADAVEEKQDDGDDDDDTTDVINWSGTHKVTIANKNYWEPESIEDVERIVKDCHKRGQSLRPIGSSLSPNGIALNGNGMISMANMDNVLKIDTEKKTITVEAGIPVREVIEALRPHNLTLPNLASIAEQQMGGFTQIGAHGTGMAVAPVDEYVTKLKIVTPGRGTIELSKEKDGRLFELARVGLGLLGVIVEITMECIPAHLLIEHTFVLTRKETISRKDQLLKEHKHTRFMLIPYTDAVIVVTNDPIDQVSHDTPHNFSASGTDEEKKKPLTDLLKELCIENGQEFPSDDAKGMGFGELRGKMSIR
jgi:L-galactono-1,4-lactone dehydrogenase